jgi:hypothetical protein
VLLLLVRFLSPGLRAQLLRERGRAELRSETESRLAVSIDGELDSQAAAGTGSSDRSKFHLITT